MAPIAVGASAPTLPGTDIEDGPKAVVFYKVTCPTCQLAAPAMERLYRAFPDGFVAIVQDAPDRAEEFAARFETSFPSVSEGEPYPISNAYGLEAVPTVYLVDGGKIEDVAESWDREAWNRVGERLAELAGREAQVLSEEGDGLPAFRPG
ncbi:MAG: TlpA family protein disulfide reductase [bacterium]